MAEKWSLTWANIYLDSSQKEAAKLYASNPDAFWSALSSMLCEGYGVSVGFNPQSESFIATAIGKACEGPNMGCGMTTHAGTPEVALQRMIYKHYIMCERESWLDVAATFVRPEP